MSTVLTSQNKLKLLKMCRKINPKRTQMLEVTEFIDLLSPLELNSKIAIRMKFLTNTIQYS